MENQYSRVIMREGNAGARKLINSVFEVGDRKWRGIGSIPKSGFKLRYEFRDYDAERIFDVAEIDTQESVPCISGLVLKGVKKPRECPAFGKECTPEHPLGATMVSSEGACAAYYAYRRHGLRVSCMTRGKRYTQSPRKRGREAANSSTANAEQIGRCARQWQTIVCKAESCSSWAMAAAPAMRCTSPSNSCTRSSKNGAPSGGGPVGRHRDAYRNRQRPRFFAHVRGSAAAVRPARRHGARNQTSGKSANLNYALEAARDRGMLTIALPVKTAAGSKDIAEYCLTVPSFSIHRIQEVHMTMIHIMWDMIHVALGEEDVI